MKLPVPIAVHTINGLKDNTHNYESHKRTISAVNDLIAALGPGTAIQPQNFALGNGFGTGASISAVSGTFKRGSFTITLGSGGFVANPSMILHFPAGSLNASSVLVVRNGGNGALGFSYSEAGDNLTITLNGTGTAGQTYGFQFDVR